MAKETDIKGVFIGEDRLLDFYVTDASGNPVNMTGWSLIWVLRWYPEAPTVLVEKTTAAGISIVDGNGTNDVARVSLASSDTYDDAQGKVLIDPGTLYYALKRTDTSNKVVLAYGKFELQLAATR